MFCDEAAKVKWLSDGVAASPLYCKRWSCPECAPRRAKQVRAKARAGKPDTFLTLTVRDTEYATPALAAKALVEAWRKIRRLAIQEAKRDVHKRPLPYGAYAPARSKDGRFGDATKRVTLHDLKLPFIAVIEETERGWPHLHILARSIWIDQAWLSAQCEDLLNSPIVDVRRVRSPKGVNLYVTKYITSALKAYETLKRYWSSQDYAKKREFEKKPWFDDGIEWIKMPGTFKDVVQQLYRAGLWETEWHGPHLRLRHLTREPPS